MALLLFVAHLGSPTKYSLFPLQSILEKSSSKKNTQYIFQLFNM